MSVQLKFLGAAGGVTGSRTLVTFEGYSFLIDCGLFQGPKDVRAKNREPLLSNLGAKINAVILTHAHLDHSGYLPRLNREGFEGEIFMSDGTGDLLPVMLADAAHLEEEFAKYADKTGYSSHRPAQPLFTTQDVEQVSKKFRPLPRHEWHQLTQNISFRFVSAGHIVGASIVQISFAFKNATRILSFSGDLGHARSLTLRTPEPIVETDALVLESTYGDRLHPKADTIGEFGAIASRTLKRNGVLVIPAFAVGRSQEILHLIRKCEDEKLIPKVTVVLDSPMSKEATRIYFKHPEDHNEGCTHASGRIEDCFLPHHFSTTSTSDESMLTCMKDGPMIVISAAGMLNGGRILHHLKSRLPHEKNTILFCGFQAEGTKGRFLQDNANNLEFLRIHHEEVPVEAEIATMASLSAHGDYADIGAWIEKMQKKPHLVFLNHGDIKSLEAMKDHVQLLLPSAQVNIVREPSSFSFF
ncbi:MAG: MBL fold metallo-hydrolase [Proteobacteria bacterium]|nr:MBL fold metallo-hydrolase [Pseudomonadota bacterium]